LEEASSFEEKYNDLQEKTKLRLAKEDQNNWIDPATGE